MRFIPSRLACCYNDRKCSRDEGGRRGLSENVFHLVCPAPTTTSVPIFPLTSLPGIAYNMAGNEANPSPPIAIIDYGMGNLRSVQKGFEKVGHRALVTNDPAQVAAAAKVVLPGVGAFEDAIAELRRLNLVGPVREAIDAGKPFLGICLGLQLLFDVSYENGRHEGLGVLPGEVVRFDLPKGYTVPHMGWNQLTIRRPAAHPRRHRRRDVRLLRPFLLRCAERFASDRHRNRLRRRRSARWSGATTCWPRSSIRRRASRKGCAFSRTSPSCRAAEPKLPSPFGRGARG